VVPPAHALSVFSFFLTSALRIELQLSFRVKVLVLWYQKWPPCPAHLASHHTIHVSAPPPIIPTILSTDASDEKQYYPMTMSDQTSSPWFDPRLTVFIIWGTFILIFICVPCKRILHKFFHRMGFPCCSHVEEDVNRANENVG